MRPLEVHGHRGARAVRPENTMAAFEHAIEAGTDYIEIDVHVTRDDALVVTHDPVMNPVICRGGRAGASAAVRELTLAEVREWDCGSLRNPKFPRQQPAPGARVPTMAEVLELAGRAGKRVNVEVKSDPRLPRYYPPPEDLAELVVRELRRHNALQRAMVQSFDFRVVRAVRELEPGLRLAGLWQGERRDFVSLARDAGAGVLAPRHDLVTIDAVRAAHKAGIAVIAWTVNEIPGWQDMITAEVDGIITDDPAGLIEWLVPRGLRKP